MRNEYTLQPVITIPQWPLCFVCGEGKIKPNVQLGHDVCTVCGHVVFNTASFPYHIKFQGRGILTIWFDDYDLID